MAVSIAVVCEAPADQRTGCDLADRVFCAEVDWIEEAMLDNHRRWRGFDSGEPCLLWKNVRDLAKLHRIKAHGTFDGEPGAPDAQSARRAVAAAECGG